MSERKSVSDNATSMKPETDELLGLYSTAAANDGFTPATRVRGAVLMYARTLAEHRNAFPGSVAHRNEDEELELSSVPREGKTLTPGPLPHIKPLPGENEDHDSWPREIPTVKPRSAWLSLGQWVAAAVAGGLALGASYSWFNASRYKSPSSPEPVLAQAQIPAQEAPATPSASPPPAAEPKQAEADKAAEPDKPVAKTKSEIAVAAASPAQATKPAKATSAKLNVPAAAPPLVLADAGPAAGNMRANRQLGLPAGASSNPPVVVADGSAIAAPQISARPLSAVPAAEQAVVAAAPATPPVALPAPAAAPSVAGASTAAASTARNTRALIAQERIDREADPAKWMLYINDLRSRAHAREADAELARLRERFPQFAPAKPATPSSAP